MRTYRSKFIAYASLLIIILIAVQVNSYFSTRKVFLKESQYNLKRTAELLQIQLNHESQELMRYASIVSNYQQLQEYIFIIVEFDTGRDEIVSLYNEQFGSLPIDRVLIIDNKKQIILGQEHEDLLPLLTLKNQEPIPYYKQTQKGLELIAEVPVIYRKKHLGFIVFTKKLNQKWINRHQSDSGEQLIIEYQGQVQASTIVEFSGKKFQTSKNQLVLAKETYQIIPVQLKNLLSKDSRLWLAISSTQISLNLKNYARNAAMQIIFSMVVIGILGFLIAKNLDQSLKKLSELIKEISKGGLPVIPKSEEQTEVGILTNQFTDMIESLHIKEAEVRKFHKQLKKAAATDVLTGLYNRRAFETVLERVVRNARFGTQTHALCYMDLDQFKVVNDTCGHFAGDELLKQITHIVLARIRGTDFLARIGGDEFALIMSKITKEQATAVCKDILHIIQEYRFTWEDKVFSVGASMGLLIIDKDVEDRDEALRRVDIACYDAKNKGRNRIEFANFQKKDVVMEESVNWIKTLHEALNQHKFCLWAQPIYRTENYQKDKVEYVEILIRLKRDDGKIIMPGTFIPAAERYKVMPLIDREVIALTCDYIHSHNDLAIKSFAINLSGISMMDAKIFDFIKNKIQEMKIDPSKLCFEITETAMISNFGEAIELIKNLKDLGCDFALDDFGAGMSSFKYLKHFPVDLVKIDGSFIKNLLDNHLDEALVEAINNVVHILDKKTVAEFVETQEILDKLVEMKVDYVQGYHLAKPKPLEDF